MTFYIMYCLIACELFLRFVSPVPLLPHGWRVTYYGLRGNEINRSYWHHTLEYRITMRTNSKGVRADSEIPYEKPEGVKRIVLLGDSFAMGFGVNLEDTFSSQMQKFLKNQGINTEIINLGIPTYGNAEALIALKEEGLKYQPDLVVLAWHPSDYSENIQSNLFGLEEGRLICKNKTYLPKARLRQFLFQFKGYRWLVEHSQFYAFFRHVVYLHIRKPLADEKQRMALLLTNKSGNTMAVATPETQAESHYEYRCMLTIELLKEMKRMCDVNNIGFLVLDIPIRLSRSEFESRFPDDEQTAMCHFEMFNPIERFKKYRGEIIYWEKSEGHFTPLGCRIVGEGLAEVALLKNLLNKKTAQIGKDISIEDKTEVYVTDKKQNP